MQNQPKKIKKDLALYEIKPGKLAPLRQWFDDLQNGKHFQALIEAEKIGLGRAFGSIIKVGQKHYAIFFEDKKICAEAQEEPTLIAETQSVRKPDNPPGRLGFWPAFSLERGRKLGIPPKKLLPADSLMSQHEKIKQECLFQPAVRVNLAYDLTGDLW